MKLTYKQIEIKLVLEVRNRRDRFFDQQIQTRVQGHVMDLLFCLDSNDFYLKSVHNYEIRFNLHVVLLRLL